MAASCSFQEGQDVMACQLCEETQEIKWKCMTCEFLMCTRCCKIHQKVKSTGDHDVVSIKDITIQTAESETKKEFTKITCKTHDGQICCLFCQDCNEVVCPLCIADSHNKHGMEEISKRYKFCVQKLKERSSKLDQEGKDLEQDALTLESTRSTEKDKLETGKQNLLHQDKALKDAVDQHTKKLLGDLDEKWGIVDKLISSQKTKVSQRTHYVEEEKNSINHAVTSENIEEVFLIALRRDEENKTQLRELVYVKDKVPCFVKGEINQLQMESIYGNLVNESATDKIEFKVEEKYSTNYSSVENLLSCPDGSIWIGHSKMSGIVVEEDGSVCISNSYMLENISLSNGDVHTNKNYIPVIHINNIALMPNGDLLLSAEKNDLRLIPKSTGQIEISQFRLDLNQCAWALHVTRDIKILVGAFKTRNTFPENPADGEGQVVVFNINGKKERVYGTENDKTLYTVPFRITTDSNNNIYVLDAKSEEETRLVMLNQWGEVRAIYTGHPVENKEKPMGIGDLVVTKSDNVILTDNNYHALHVLNNEGQCIAYNTAADLGIELPFSLAIDNRGFLVIGCGRHHAKIYVVKFSGC